MKVRFSDGVEVETDGELRILELHDGLYVVGNGFLIPVSSRQEAQETIREMKKGAS